MKSRIPVFIGILATLTSISCSTFTFDSQGPFIGSGKFSEIEVLSQATVEGEACVNGYLFFVSLDEGSPAAAFQVAMSKSPAGTRGLSNVEIEMVERWYLIFHQKCIVVSGKPSRRSGG